MKIVLVTSHLDTGGIASYLLTLSRGLLRHGHSVSLASGGGALQDAFCADGVRLLRLPLRLKAEAHPLVLVSALRLAGWVKREGVNLIHAQTRVAAVAAAWASRFSGIPYLTTCHGFFRPSWHRRFFPCWGERTIAISSQVAEHLRADFSLPPGRISLVHNGIDLRRFCDAPCAGAAEALGIGGTGPVVGCIARLSDVKGLEYLVRAMPQVCRAQPQARLVIIGEGKMRPQLLGLIRELGLQGRAFLLPTVTDTARALSAMDVFVLPSLQEGLGLALMEAMAASRAVVGSSVGGIRTLIEDGRSGLLVEPRDSDALAGAILSLLRDPAARERLGAAARERIERDFSQEQMVQETERVYSLCVGN